MKISLDTSICTNKKVILVRLFLIYFNSKLSDKISQLLNQTNVPVIARTQKGLLVIHNRSTQHIRMQVILQMHLWDWEACCLSTTLIVAMLIHINNCNNRSKSLKNRINKIMGLFRCSIVSLNHSHPHSIRFLNYLSLRMRGQLLIQKLRGMPCSPRVMDHIRLTRVSRYVPCSHPTLVNRQVLSLHLFKPKKLQSNSLHQHLPVKLKKKTNLDLKLQLKDTIIVVQLININKNFRHVKNKLMDSKAVAKAPEMKWEQKNLTNNVKNLFLQLFRKI